MRSKLALAGAALALAVAVACSANEGTCLRMSDCEAPFVCVEGTCRSDEVLTSAAPDDAGASDQ